MRTLIFAGMTVLFSLAITQAFLRFRGIRRSKFTSLWDFYMWEFFPKDEQTRRYAQARFLTALIVLPSTALVVHLLIRAYEIIEEGTRMKGAGVILLATLCLLYGSAPAVSEGTRCPPLQFANLLNEGQVAEVQKETEACLAGGLQCKGCNTFKRPAHQRCDRTTRLHSSLLQNCNRGPKYKRLYEG